MESNNSSDRIREQKQNDDRILSQMEIIIKRAIGTATQESWQESESADIDAINLVLCHYVRLKPKKQDYRTLEDYIWYQTRSGGVMHRVVELTDGWEKCSHEILLGIRLDNDTLVALFPRMLGGYRYFDSAEQQYKNITKENVGMFSPEALQFYPALPNKSITPREFLRFCRSQLDLPSWLSIAAYALLLGFCACLIPVSVNGFFGLVLPSGDYGALFPTGFFLLAIIVTYGIYNLSQSLFMNRVIRNMVTKVEAASYSRLLLLPLDFFRRYEPSDLSSRVRYLGICAEKYLSAILLGGTNIIFSLLYLILIYQASPDLLPITLGITGAVLLLTAIAFPFRLDNAKRLYPATIATDALGYSILSGAQKIRTTGSLYRMFIRWCDSNSKETILTYRPPAIVQIYDTLFSSALYLGIILVCFFSVRSGSADIFACYLLISTFLGESLSIITKSVLSLTDVIPMLHQAEPILSEAPEVWEGRERVTNLKGQIDFSGVSFRHEHSSSYTFDNLNLHITPGEYVVVCGESSSGKSALMDLMLGYALPERGIISYDGKNIDNLDFGSLRANIGTVTSQDRLIPGSIRSNISLTAAHLSDEDIWEALRITGIDEKIRKLPMGLDTVISETMGGFSQGEKQRLIIARAIAAKPKIVIIDEATNALDPLSAKSVYESLDKLPCTRIVFAHSSFQTGRCDAILVLEDGHVRCLPDTDESRLLKAGSPS